MAIDCGKMNTMRPAAITEIFRRLAACTHHHGSSYNGVMYPPDEDDDLPQTIEIQAPTAGSAGVRPLTASSLLEVFSL